MKWYNKCIDKYGWILLSLYKNNDYDKYNNYISNLNKLLLSLQDYQKNVNITDQQNHDLNILINNISILLLNGKNMVNNMVNRNNIQIGGYEEMDGGKKHKKSKRSSKKILSPKRMYSTIAKGW